MPDQRPTRHIFVIMPFSRADQRDADDLTAFFETNLKGRIEAEEAFRYRYVVERSADQFAINEHIITSLNEADIVLCDLSGSPPNPNVMFELGVRLAVSDQPVIMFRADNPGNQPMFDISNISSYYIHPYSPLRYAELEAFLVESITAYEEGTSAFQSPVLATLRHAPTIRFQLRKGAAFQRLRMLTDGLGVLAARYAGDLFDFLKRNGVNVVSPIGPRSVFDFLVQKRDDLSVLPWGTFVVQPVRMPAVDAFLVDPFLAGFLPMEADMDFSFYVLLFHGVWLNHGEPYHVSSLGEAAVKLQELLVFREMIPPVVQLVLHGESGKERYLQDFYCVLGASSLKADVDRLKGMSLIQRVEDDEDTRSVGQSPPAYPEGRADAPFGSAEA